MCHLAEESVLLGVHSGYRGPVLDIDAAFTDMLKSGEIRRIVERYGVPFYPPFDDTVAPRMNAGMADK